LTPAHYQIFESEIKSGTLAVAAGSSFTHSPSSFYTFLTYYIINKIKLLNIG